MPSIELKRKFIEFFKSKGHEQVPNSSLIPENDPSALFTNSGMHPLVPYLLGEPHPFGTRLMNYQRAVRTGDIEEVGDNTHHTFFEMLGEWSLGDYGKKESLNWSFEFLVDVLGMDPKRLYPSVYKGSERVARDEEAIEIWKEIFKKYGMEATVHEGFENLKESDRIIALGDDDNFWKVGAVGPCGPTSEIYYDRGVGRNSDERFLEVCNNVFMSYYIDQEGNLNELDRKNIDVGWGFERLVSVLQNLQENGDLPLSASVYDTDLFNDEKIWLLGKFGKNLDDYENDSDLKHAVRAILDHIRASVVIIGDGIEPSNKDQGYVLRRLIRRAVTFGKKYFKSNSYISELAIKFIEKLSKDSEYKFLSVKKDQITLTLNEEIKKFEKALSNGVKELNRFQGEKVPGELIFKLKEAFGLPIEITEQIAKDHNKTLDLEKYEELLKEHQEKSRTAAKGKFVGGLGDHSPESIRYHTCAHLFLAGAQKFLGEDVHQKGQNITPERLRYDISYPTPISKELLEKIENWINDQIEKELKVDHIEVSLDEAKKMKAEGVFGDKYAKLNSIKVYRIYDENDSSENKFVSLEICGGPHVENTREIKDFGKLKIIKEESSGGGVRRIKAVLQK